MAEVAGLPVPPGLAGRSLTAALPGKSEPLRRAARAIYGETLYPRLHLGWSDLASLIDAKNHYIESPRPELYDLVADPGEKNDLSAGLPPAFRSMRAELARLPRPLQAPGSSDPEQIKKLAALGYISASGGGSREEGPSGAARPHRRRRAAQGRLQRAHGPAGTQKPRRFSRPCSRRSPGMTDVWQMYSEALMKLGREKEALAALQTAAKLSPGSPQVMMALSEYFMETGDYAEARRHAEAIGDAGTASPHENLARIALAEGDLAAAEKEARAALERYPSRRVPRQILGKVLQDRGDYPGALVELDLAAQPRAGETAVPLQNLQFLRGDCLARLGRLRESEAAFQEEIRVFPGNAAPRAALAMLYASQGREAEARQALTDLVVQLKTPEAYFTASRTYEVLGDAASAGQLRAEARRLVSRRERPGQGGRSGLSAAGRRSPPTLGGSFPSSPPASPYAAGREVSVRRRRACRWRRARRPGCADDERHRVQSCGLYGARRSRDRSSARRCRGRPS